ncbi:MAG: hypothetical protein ISN28_06050 [Ectothiorhodospiraceae bacterium AqS1]|nr:hypothetical protein [Ectothiorhodospiraceae bacterium AqS1]
MSIDSNDIFKDLEGAVDDDPKSATRYEVQCILTRRDGTAIGDWQVAPLWKISDGIEHDWVREKRKAIYWAEKVSIVEDPSLDDEVTNEFRAEFSALCAKENELIEQCRTEEGKAKFKADYPMYSGVAEWWSGEYGKFQERESSLVRAAKGYQGSMPSRHTLNFRKEIDKALYVCVREIPKGKESYHGHIVWDYGNPPLKAPSIKTIEPHSKYPKDCKRILTLEDVGRVKEWIENDHKPARAEHYDIGKQCSLYVESASQAGGSRFYCGKHARLYGNNPNKKKSDA